MLFYRIFPAIAAGCAALMDIHIQNAGSRRHQAFECYWKHDRTDENSQLHFLFLSDWSCHISCSYDFKRHCLPANSLLITLHQCLFQNRKKRTLLQKRYAVGKLSFHSSYIFKCIALCGRCLLKKNIFAVCDLEVDYALNFMDYLNHKKNIPLPRKPVEVHFHSDPHGLSGILSDNLQS